MKKDIFEISGKAALGLIITAVIIPSLAVPALFLTPIASFIWLLGECAASSEQTNK